MISLLPGHSGRPHLSISLVAVHLERPVRVVLTALPIAADFTLTLDSGGIEEARISLVLLAGIISTLFPF